MDRKILGPSVRMHLACLNYCMPLVLRLVWDSGSLVCWLAVFDSKIGAFWAHWGDPNSTREIDGMPTQQVICTMLHTQSLISKHEPHSMGRLLPTMELLSAASTLFPPGYSTSNLPTSSLRAVERSPGGDGTLYGGLAVALAGCSAAAYWRPNDHLRCDRRPGFRTRAPRGSWLQIQPAHLRSCSPTCRGVA
jgi:hypothetical protein